MTVKTRQQRFFSDALKRMEDLQKKPDDVQKAYGGLCHMLPFLIRNDGLCQAVAWIEAKSTEKPEAPENPERPVKDKPLTLAYRELREHIALLLGEEKGSTLLHRIQNEGVTAYMHDTRTILDAWVYYKRFASSVLGVDPSVNASEVGA